MNLKFSEFWIPALFACAGMVIGGWLGGYKLTSAWLGMIAGLFVGIIVMLPIFNKTAREKLKKLLGRGDMSRFDIVFIILIFTACGAMVGAGYSKPPRTIPTYKMLIGGITGAFLGTVLLVILIKIGEYAKNKDEEDK